MLPILKKGKIVHYKFIIFNSISLTFCFKNVTVKDMLVCEDCFVGGQFNTYWG